MKDNAVISRSIAKRKKSGVQKMRQNQMECKRKREQRSKKNELQSDERYESHGKQIPFYWCVKKE